MDGGGASGASEPPAGVPTEDAVQALIDHLVFPLLPMRASSTEPPSEHQQEVVAKQMHAVVLLYNYYHRKQFPHLEFLGFESFCKVAVIAKPSLLMYMKLMRGCEEESGDLDTQLSITERTIMDACNICTSLDASKDSPNMESWPVSKVAVFLIDHTKAKCLLQFCTITQGVWSLVEKVLDGTFDNPVGGSQMKKQASKKRAASGSSGDKSYNTEDIFHQLALSVVKEKTGIDQSSLSVLEHHMVYSLSQERTTTRLYVMMYTEAVNEELMEVPIKDVMNSLRGPLFKTGKTPEMTPVVEYYHLLPYVDVLSNWLSREACHDGSLHVVKPQEDVDAKCSLEPDREPTMEDHDLKNKSEWNEQPANFPSNKTRKIENETTSKIGDEPFLSGAGCRPQNIIGTSSVEPDGLPTMEIQEMNDKSYLSAQTMNILSDKKNLIKNTLTSKKGIGGSCMSGSTEAVCYKKADSSSLNHDQQLSLNVEDGSRKTTISEVHIEKRKMTSNQVGLDATVNGFKDKAAMTDSVKKSYITKNIDGEPFGRTVTSDAAQERIATRDLPLVPVQFTSGNQGAFHLVTARKKNDLLRASLDVLYRKRTELHQQQQLLEDEVAQCEMNIQTILNGGEENLTSNIELIIEACHGLCSSQMRTGTSLRFEERSPPQTIKRKRLSEAVLSLRSSCQELDDICYENSWILPRYSVLPSFADGRFQANVTVQGMDFDFTGAGGLKGCPREARESAASHMLSKLRSMSSQAQ